MYSISNMSLTKMLAGGSSFIEKQGERILYNRFVLYFIIFIVFFNLIGHSLHGDLMTPLIFILVSYVTSFFSKNMIVILSMGLVVSNVCKYGAHKIRIEEGMKNEKEPTEADAVDEPEKRIDTPKSSLKITEVLSRKKDLDFIKDKYGDLLKLQNQIIDNVGSLEKTLGKMDTIVSDVRENVTSLKTEADALQNA